MKKSRTARAVDALMRDQSRQLEHDDKWYRENLRKRPRSLTVYHVAKRYGLDISGVSRAFKRRLRQRRCPECKQVIR
jgi:hypothetical protein